MRSARSGPEKLVLHAAQNPKVTANAYALAATQKAATRLQKIAANDPDPEGDDESAVSATMCWLEVIELLPELLDPQCVLLALRDEGRAR